MKKELIFFIFSAALSAISVLFVSCNSSPNPDEYVISKGGILAATLPESGFQILVDRRNTGKVTPDSIINLEAGKYTVSLTKYGFYDTTYDVNVTLGYCIADTVNMTNLRFLKYFSTVVYMGVGDSAGKPGALVFSNGVQAGVKDTNKIDLLYYYDDSGKPPSAYLSTPSLLTWWSSRSTYFLLTNSTDITDGAPVPKAYSAGDSDWKKSVPDTISTYFFAYNTEGYYTKLKITNKNGTSMLDSAWVQLSGYYNLTPNSLNFK